jgi:hypothetical protein
LFVHAVNKGWILRSFAFYFDIFVALYQEAILWHRKTRADEAIVQLVRMNELRNTPLNKFVFFHPFAIIVQYIFLGIS